MACHLLSSGGCSNPPAQAEAPHVVGDGVHAATAAPWPASAALPTGRAWPGAGGLQTSVGWGPEAHGGTLLLQQRHRQTVGVAACHGRGAGR